MVILTVKIHASCLDGLWLFLTNNNASCIMSYFPFKYCKHSAENKHSKSIYMAKYVVIFSITFSEPTVFCSEAK